MRIIPKLPFVFFLATGLLPSDASSSGGICGFRDINVLHKNFTEQTGSNHFFASVDAKNAKAVAGKDNAVVFLPEHKVVGEFVDAKPLPNGKYAITIKDGDKTRTLEVSAEGFGVSRSATSELKATKELSYAKKHNQVIKDKVLPNDALKDPTGKSDEVFFQGQDVKVTYKKGDKEVSEVIKVHLRDGNTIWVDKDGFKHPIELEKVTSIEREGQKIAGHDAKLDKILNPAEKSKQAPAKEVSDTKTGNVASTVEKTGPSTIGEARKDNYFVVTKYDDLESPGFDGVRLDQSDHKIIPKSSTISFDATVNGVPKKGLKGRLVKTESNGSLVFELVEKNADGSSIQITVSPKSLQNIKEVAKAPAPNPDIQKSAPAPAKEVSETKAANASPPAKKSGPTTIGEARKENYFVVTKYDDLESPGYDGVSLDQNGHKIISKDSTISFDVKGSQQKGVKGRLVKTEPNGSLVFELVEKNADGSAVQITVSPNSLQNIKEVANAAPAPRADIQKPAQASNPVTSEAPRAPAATTYTAKNQEYYIMKYSYSVNKGSKEAAELMSEYIRLTNLKKAYDVPNSTHEMKQTLKKIKNELGYIKEHYPVTRELDAIN